MNFAVSTVVLVLSMFVLDICYGETEGSLTCDQLPKLDVPSIELLIANSPFENDYTLSSSYECATLVFTNPARGTSGYSGTMLGVESSNVIAVDYSISSSGKSTNATVCSTGSTSVWYVSAAQKDDSGAFFCVYSCDNNGLKEFACASNNNGASPAELEAVNLAKRVANGDNIRKKHSCSARHGCEAF